MGVNVFTISINWKFKCIIMKAITEKQQKQLLNYLVKSKDVCIVLSKDDKKVLKAIKKTFVEATRPLKLSPPTIFLQS